MSTTLTPKELAMRLDSDPRTIRKFLRSEDGMNMKVGKGQRWAIEAKQVRSLKSRYNKWIEAQRPKQEEQEESDTTETD